MVEAGSILEICLLLKLNREVHLGHLAVGFSSDRLDLVKQFWQPLGGFFLLCNDMDSKSQIGDEFEGKWQENCLGEKLALFCFGQDKYRVCDQDGDDHQP